MLSIQTARVFKPLLKPSRYKGAHGGRGSGKSHFFAELAVERSLLDSGLRVACIREVQNSLKESVKRLLEDKIEALGVSSKFGIFNDHITTPGKGVMIFQGMKDHSAESVKSLEGFDIAYVEEAQTLSERSLEMLRPTIRADGSEIWCSWNPRSKRDPVDALLRGANKPPDAIVVQANYKDNPFFPKELEAERLHDLANKPERYAHIWEGDYEPAALGAYYALEMAAAAREKRISRVPHMPGIPVETWWDLGARKQGRTMAVGFVQRVGHELHAIDFLCDEGPEKGLPHFARELQRKQSELGYVYSEHVWPHDGGHLQKATGETLAETWLGLMGKMPQVLAINDVAPGIDAVRNMLPLMWWDAERCAGWVDALKNYRADYNDKMETYNAEPRHDWASHPADMTRTGAMYVPADPFWGSSDANYPKLAIA